MSVYYRCVGGPLDGREIKAPAMEFTGRLDALAELKGVEAPVPALFVDGHYGAYLFDDQTADALIWVDLKLAQQP